jgi:hypothetical protein
MKWSCYSNSELKICAVESGNGGQADLTALSAEPLTPAISTSTRGGFCFQAKCKLLHGTEAD